MPSKRLVMCLRPVSFVLLKAVERKLLSKSDHVPVAPDLGDNRSRRDKRLRFVTANNGLLKKKCRRSLDAPVEEYVAAAGIHSKPPERAGNREAERGNEPFAVNEPLAHKNSAETASRLGPDTLELCLPQNSLRLGKLF